MATQASPGATLIESIQGALVAAAEIGGNRLLDLDENALAACAEMQGQCIAIEVTDLDFQLYCHPGNWGIRLSRFPPVGEVNATISGHLLALFNLAAHAPVASAVLLDQRRRTFGIFDKLLRIGDVGLNNHERAHVNSPDGFSMTCWSVIR